MIRQFLSRTDLAESGIFVAPDNDELCDRIWERGKSHDPRGADGAFLRQFPHRFIPDVVDGIYSYKRHCQEALPNDARVCCFHGKPWPDQTDGWAKDFWLNSLH